MQEFIHDVEVLVYAPEMDTENTDPVEFETAPKNQVIKGFMLLEAVNATIFKAESWWI